MAVALVAVMALLAGAVPQAASAFPPLVVTHAATEVTSTEAKLNGAVVPMSLTGSYHFEYGTTTSYGSSTPPVHLPADMEVRVIAEVISGLAPETTYHFRLVGNNSTGTSKAKDLTFTTP